MTNIREAQIYQKTPGVISLRIVKGEKYTDSDHNVLVEKLHERFDDKLDISIEYVSELARTKTGKLRFVISDVGKGRLSFS
jgi:phenylacetate-CoA ligase